MSLCIYMLCNGDYSAKKKSVMQFCMKLSINRVDHNKCRLLHPLLLALFYSSFFFRVVVVVSLVHSTCIYDL